MTEALQRATRAHVAALAAIHAMAFPPHEAWGEDAIALQLAMPGVLGLLHARGGMILIRVTEDEAEVLTLATTPGRRRRGVARALLDAAQRLAFAHGARKAFLEVAHDNIAAIALYERAGFSRVGRRPGYYARPFGSQADALVLSRTLEPGDA